MLFCVIYFVFTVFVPVRATYRVLAKDEDDQNEYTHGWSVYWALYAFALLLKHNLPILKLYSVH